MWTHEQASEPAFTQWQAPILVVRMAILSFMLLAGWLTLSPAEQAQARAVRSNAGGGIIYAVVHDVTHGRYFSYYGPGQFTAASSMKVPIMLTLLNMVERQGRAVTANERSLLATMIENSNNDAATALYNEVGKAAGVTNFMSRIGVGGLYANNNAWGWSLISPWTMTNLLSLLNAGAILNPRDRALALNLLYNVEADQRAGVGDTAPAGAAVALKDGWVIAPDGLWAVNSSGIVSTRHETYIISVYTQREPSLAAGLADIRRICSQVAARLR